jgi:hypothetical protein
MRFPRATILAALVVLISADSRAALRINFDSGGSLAAYIEKYQALRDAEAKVVIDGVCISACTLITGFLNEDQVCVTPRARMAFHSAQAKGEHSSEGTRLMWSMYPERVRLILLKRGWNGDSPQNEHADLIYVEGEELKIIYPGC